MGILKNPINTKATLVLFILIIFTITFSSLFLTLSTPADADTSFNLTGFPIPTSNSAVDDIVAGPDGNLWFTETDGNKIGRITPNGTRTEFPLPTVASYPRGITSGPGGALWFVEDRSSTSPVVGRMTSNGVITGEFPLTKGYSPDRIVMGHDDNLWISTQGNAIERVTSSGTVTEFPLPSGDSFKYFTTGSDGNLWFLSTGSDIQKMTLSGVVTDYPIPSGADFPIGITTGADGNVWFITDNDSIGRVTPSGVVTQFPISNVPELITAGTDGNVWFIKDNATIGRITPSGVITEFPIIPGGFHTSLSGSSIATGSDGNFWATNSYDNNIEKLSLSNTTPIVTPTSTPPSLGLCVQNFSTSTGNTTMSQRYTLTATVVNLSEKIQSGTLTITEKGANPAFQDKEADPVNVTIPSLYPGTSQKVTIPYVHSWRWLYPIEQSGNNDKLIEFFVDQTKGVLGDIIKGLEPLSKVADILTTLSTYQKAHITSSYRYTYNLPHCDSTVPTVNNVKVTVQDSKRYELVSSLTSNLLSGKATTTGLFEAFFAIVIPETSPIVGTKAVFDLSTQVGLRVFSDAMLHSAEDPDPNYTQIVQASPVPIPNTQTLTGKDADAFVHLANAIGDVQAAGKAQAKADGASEDGNTNWTTLQLRYAKLFLTQTLYELNGYLSDDDSLKLSQKAYVASPLAMTDVTNYLTQYGLPPLEVNSFTQLGYTPQEIQEILNVQRLTMPAYQDKYASADPSTDLLPPIENLLLDVNTQIASASSNTNTAIDTIPPITKIAVQGTLGNNNMYVSPVQVTITATDNVGGSGVKISEYSMDNGNTWIPYTNPLTFSNDGTYVVLSRATDNDGNTQFPSSTQTVTIDTKNIIRLGGMNLDGYCNNQNKKSAKLHNNIWVCTKDDTSINLTKACIWQYANTNATASQDSANNPYTWSCYIPQSTVTPSPTSTQKRLGGMNLNGYCQSLSKGDAILNTNIWKCKSDNLPITLTKACSWQYAKKAAVAVQDIANNAYSWSCYIQN